MIIAKTSTNTAEPMKPISSLAEQAPAGEGRHGLDQLKALVGGRGPGVAVGVQPGDPVRLHDNEADEGRNGQHTAQEHMEKPCTGRQKHHAHHRDHDDRCADVLLKRDETRKPTDEYNRGEKAHPEFPQLRMALEQERREQNHHGGFGNLTGLKAQNTEPQPACGAAGFASKRTEHHRKLQGQGSGENQNQEPAIREPVVVEAGHDEHHHQADHGKPRLSLGKMQWFHAKGAHGDNRARTEHHQHPRKAEQEGQVEQNYGFALHADSPSA